MLRAELALPGRAAQLSPLDREGGRPGGQTGSRRARGTRKERAGNDAGVHHFHADAGLTGFNWRLPTVAKRG